MHTVTSDADAPRAYLRRMLTNTYLSQRGGEVTSIHVLEAQAVDGTRQATLTAPVATACGVVPSRPAVC